MPRYPPAALSREQLIVDCAPAAMKYKESVDQYKSKIEAAEVKAVEEFRKFVRANP